MTQLNNHWYWLEVGASRVTVSHAKWHIWAWAVDTAEPPVWDTDVTNSAPPPPPPPPPLLFQVQFVSHCVSFPLGKRGKEQLGDSQPLPEPVLCAPSRVSLSTPPPPRCGWGVVSHWNRCTAKALIVPSVYDISCRDSPAWRISPESEAWDVEWESEWTRYCDTPTD